MNGSVNTSESSAVVSRDGTRISYSSTGSGPVVVLVDGAMCHRRLGSSPKLVPLLSSRFTVVTYDRRGRGESDDGPAYAVEREIEDLAAVVDAVGGQAAVLGMSSGAALAVRAAAAGVPITRLALFEPPYVGDGKPDDQPPSDALEQIRAFVGDGRNGAAISYFLTRVFGMPGAVVALFKLFRSKWALTARTAPTLPYDLEIMGNWKAPAAQLGALTTPTQVICGDKSPDKLQAAHRAMLLANPALVSSRLRGQGHNASMKVLAPVVADFLAGNSEGAPA